MLGLTSTPNFHVTPQSKALTTLCCSFSKVGMGEAQNILRLFLLAEKRKGIELVNQHKLCLCIMSLDCIRWESFFLTSSFLTTGNLLDMIHRVIKESTFSHCYAEGMKILFFNPVPHGTSPSNLRCSEGGLRQLRTEEQK